MEENACKYVNSRGLLKSCNIHSRRPISSIQQMIEYDFKDIKDGSSLYVASSALKHFVAYILPVLTHKVVIVSGDCDETCWNDLFTSYKDFLAFIENDKIIHWFSQNCIAVHPKLTQMPIGLDYHTMSNNHPKWGPKLKPVEQEKVLNEIISSPNIKPFWEREIKCYSNFHFCMTTRFGYDRQDALKNIPKDLVYYEPVHLLRQDSWNNQIKHAFVISPHGGGLDCHRTWEALVLGCIPIVKTSGLDSLYRDLPVLIVKDWSDVTDSLLQSTVRDFRDRVFNYDRLLLSYWVKLIETAQDTVKSKAN
jgi:hypothetical protein